MLINNLANLNRSTRGIIFTALIIIAAIAMYNWMIAPHVAYLFAAQGYESTMTKIAGKNKTITAEVKAKTKKLEELREQLAAADSKLFTADEAKEFFSSLQAISEKTGCIVHSLNITAGKPFSKDKQSEDSSIIIVSDNAVLSFTGRYGSITRLLEKVQNYPKKIWVNSFKMESPNLSSALLKCEMVITIYTIQDKKD